MPGENFIPTITTPRLLLRGLTPGDVKPLHRILKEPDTLRHFPNPDPPDIENVESPVEHQLAHWKEHRFGWWGVEHRERSELIGWNGLG
jgi:[ribosomal protein S5]-alanine N-acetyltransferase